MKLKTKIVSYVSAALAGLVAVIAIILFWGIQPNRLQKFEQATMLKVAAVLSYELGTEIRTDNYWDLADNAAVATANIRRII
ncbi:MAG: hypothetical protein GY801_49990 [bacterium]|nr:hypothetical protein [bacterium]